MYTARYPSFYAYNLNYEYKSLSNYANMNLKAVSTLHHSVKYKSGGGGFQEYLKERNYAKTAKWNSLSTLETSLRMYFRIQAS